MNLFLITDVGATRQGLQARALASRVRPAPPDMGIAGITSPSAVGRPACSAVRRSRRTLRRTGTKPTA
jgi:hypothetical protein